MRVAAVQLTPRADEDPHHKDIVVARVDGAPVGLAICLAAVVGTARKDFPALADRRIRVEGGVA